MAKKNYAEVLIDGKIYTLAGEEDQAYLQKVASYISDKIAEVKAVPGYGRQNKDYQEVMIYLNLADDYFKAGQQAALYKEEKEELDKEVYSLKHDLVSLQMKLDAEKEKNKKKKSGEEETEKEKADPEAGDDEGTGTGGEIREPGEDNGSGEDKEPGEGDPGEAKEPGTDENRDNVIVNVNSYSSKSKKHKKGH